MTRALRCVAVATAISIAFVGCSDDPGIDSLRAAAEDFTDAWLAQDSKTMVERFDDESRSALSSKALARRISRTLEDGAITLFELDVGKVEQPDVDEEDADGIEAAVPYTIAYSSRAASESVEFDGSMDFVYEDGSWKVAWDDSYMWPGVEGAAGFAVDIKRSRRASILDRNGKVLARGSGDGRTYPFGSIAGSTIGHIAPLPKRAAKATDEPSDYVGVSGLEEGIDDRLNAASSTDLILVDQRGETIEVLGSKTAGKPTPVETTLDIKVQRAAENAYGGTVGGAVVIDPATGDLLAVVSSAPFDPNNYVGVESVTPFNRALSGTYPPGSSLKVLTAAAAIEEGVVTPKSTVTGPPNYKGVRNFDSGSFGSISFFTATQNSVNTAYAQVAEELGGKKLTEYAKAFGFNREPAMPLGAATPSFPRPEGLSDVMWSAIGQAQVLASPLEMATVAATIANDGTRMEPRILLDSDPEGVEAVSPKTARTVTDLMEGVVTGGTGTAANLGDPSVAGKTGTAEVSVGGGIQNHAWFICFAPSDDPDVAVAVVAEFGGIGGQVAAPIAGRILRAVLPLVK